MITHFKRRSTPADKGFEAARHEPRRSRKRTLDDDIKNANSTEPEPVKPVPPVKPVEPKPDPYKQQFAELMTAIGNMDKTLQQLVESDKKVHASIEEPAKPEKVRQEVIYAWLDDFEKSPVPFDEIKSKIEESVHKGELNRKEADMILAQLR
jgi:hypothetical protein